MIISKEIATLENEMLELKGVLEEWRAVPESLEGGWGDDDLLIGGESKQAQRLNENPADKLNLIQARLHRIGELNATR